MSSVTAAASSSSGNTETQVVDDIPEALNTILLMVVKNFFSNEHFLVVYHIMRAQCIREENLKARLQFDQKQLRQLLANLKLEKLVKERIITQKNENNRTVSIIFYYINYRAVLNVVKYKIDHMRQKLESREQMDTNRAHYKCGNCQSTYEMLDISRILEIETGRLICWRCRGEVHADESVAPTKATRTAVARFNEQMNTLYSHICALNGIQLAPHLLEPDIAKYMEDDKAALQLQQQMDFTSGGGGGGQRIQLGCVAHSYHSAATINYQNGDAVFVDLNADINKGPVEEAKIIPEWLKDTAIGGEATHNDNILDQATTEEEETPSQRRFGPSIDYLKEIECEDEVAHTKVKTEEPPAKQMKLEENGDSATSDVSVKTEIKMEVDEEASEEEEEEMIHVAGRVIPLSQITPKMVEEEMSEQEQEEYCSVVQNLFAYFFVQQCSVC
uniref:HTH TFE/IIEalpha-type domain-containing protein n=1 Tax=Caenorhabditis tropicalis TaxID=1561998 RepID=A0A1I7SXV1_9PELO